MRRKSRQHPLQSFRFWFLVLAGVCVATAWKMGWLPLNHQGEETANSELVSPIDEGDAGIEFTPEAVEELMLAQSEPTLSISSTTTGETPETSLVQPDTIQPEPQPAREMPRVSSIEGNPFGTAQPEFTAIEDEGVSDEIVLTGSEEPVSTPQPIGPGDPQPADPVPQVDLTEVKALLAQGSADAEVEAHRLLSEVYWSNPAARPQLLEDVEAIARRIYFLPQPHYMDAYVVQPGDNLQTIAQKYDVSWQYLARLNRITDAGRLRAGQNLKVIRGPFTAVVDLSDHEMTIHAHGYFVFRFPVGIGSDGSSPEGSFVVEEKLVDPTYYGPDGVIANDDPLNPLGERWIGIGNSFGIHGTIAPESIGRSESRGCVRMHNQDVEIVYDLLTVGAEVIIER